MKPEDLLKILKDNGMDDKAIKELLKGVLDSFDESLGEEEKEVKDHEKEEAAKLLGVTL
jgi:hypothetical protein